MSECCAICGATKNLQRHHTSYEPEIIQLLCVDCHKAVHGHGVGKASGWTPLFEWLKEDAEILFEEGATNKEVAKACDISYATASKWRKKLGLGMPKFLKMVRGTGIMEKIPIIEKTKGMNRVGAILLLEYHRGLKAIKIGRLRRQLDRATDVHDAIFNEIGRREKEEE